MNQSLTGATCRPLYIRLKPIISVGISLLLFACGTTKNVEPAQKTVSMLDYPYIEKFHEGLRLQHKGEIENAIAALNYCLGVRRNDDAVYYALSELYLQKNDRAKSSEAIQNAARIDPTNIWYTQELAYMFFDEGKFEDAAKNFEKLVKKEPRNVDWLYGYAECLARSGEISKAIDALNRTEEQVGIQPELTLQKFNLYIRLKQADKAIAEIEKARKEFPNEPQLIGTLVDYYFQTKQNDKAIKLLENLVAADPDNGHAHLALADIYRQQGKKQDYINELKKGFACADITVDTKMKILIDLHDQTSKFDQEAYELVEIMVQQHPNDAKAYSIQGDFLLKGEREAEALAAYKNALKYDKSKYTIWNQVMIMEYQAFQFDSLFKDSKECLEVFPTIPTVYLLHGVASNQLHKYDEAITTLEAGKEIIVNDQGILSEFYSQLGEAYFGIQKYPEGKRNYESALVIDANSTLNMNNFAYRLALAKQDLGRAEELIMKALKLAPNQAHFIDTYGWVLFQQGKYELAAEQFNKAIELSPSDKVIVEHVGDAFFKNGQINKAIEMWVNAKELGSTNKNLDQKIEKKTYYEPLY